ncbi:GGDEF domain-containing protein [Aminobacter aminovorans]|uniref:diguanylate cyclase n=1 Tax=Aminobacter aminovorans TaxID=83263 RepID=A0AAC8YJM8_AMIAI|nr:GGDEF domain-containing protein [Aminobacter aminovorans]AMS39308.1 Diguanylate cyclase/phosphodiesterase [Aminobacter aminovorans]MBB3709918.1 diguanylate cyclase (GGDEF)-like protein [Aminobacter aminovorans]WMC97419.1 GGDEF domain-containing protein [Aminobacter aminovorans]
MTRRNLILAKAAVVTAIAVVSTFVLSFSIRLALGMPIDWLSWVECIVIPIVIAMPVASYIFHQSEMYKEASEALARSHAALSETHEKLNYSTSHDPATGLLNREAFIGHLARVGRDEECDMLLLIDADEFTKINDRHGHAKGDEALNRIAKALLYATRPSDVVGRTGGTEFGVILRGVDKDSAMLRAEMIRRQVETIRWMKSDRGSIRTTVSIGGAEMRGSADTAQSLRQAARCLYEAKQQGRNRVSFSYKLA